RKRVSERPRIPRATRTVPNHRGDQDGVPFHPGSPSDPSIAGCSGGIATALLTGAASVQTILDIPDCKDDWKSSGHFSHVARTTGSLSNSAQPGNYGCSSEAAPAAVTGAGFNNSVPTGRIGQE